MRRVCQKTASAGEGGRVSRFCRLQAGTLERSWLRKGLLGRGFWIMAETPYREDAPQDRNSLQNARFDGPKIRGLGTRRSRFLVSHPFARKRRKDGAPTFIIGANLFYATRSMTTDSRTTGVLGLSWPPRGTSEILVTISWPSTTSPKMV